MRGAPNPFVQNYLGNLTEQPSLVSSDRRTIFLLRLIDAGERHGRELSRMGRLHLQLGIDPTTRYIVESVDFTQGFYVSTMKLKNLDGSPYPGLGTSYDPALKDHLIQKSNGVIVFGFPDVPSENVYICGLSQVQ